MKLIYEAIKSIKNKPKLIVTDMDSCIWNLGIDDFYYTYPYKRGPKIESSEKNFLPTYRVFDRDGKEMFQYPEVHSLFNFIFNDLKIPMACASRTTYPPGSKLLLDLYNWSDFFVSKQIFPGSKFAHFENIKKETKIDYQDMIFFDDEMRNIRDISSINVTSILVNPNDGLSFNYLKEGFEQHSKKIEKLGQ